MKRICGFLAGVGLLVTASCGVAQAVPTPPFAINGNEVIADVMKYGKVEIEYDIRPVYGTQLELYVNELPLEDGKVYEPYIVLDKPYGKFKLDMMDLPEGIYVLRGWAIDDNGNTVAEISRPEYLRYGGTKARQNYEKRAAQIDPRSKKADTFTDVTSLDNIPDLATSIKPAAKAIKPGETLRLSYIVDVDFNMDTDDAQKVMEDYDTKVYWKLEGAGKLRILSSTEALYEAPEEGEHIVKVRVRLFENENEATIYVTNAKLGGELIMQPQPGT